LELQHSFTVPADVDTAWAALLDLETVAPCFPGATLTGREGDEFSGQVRVKLGPVSLQYAGKGRFVERDEAAHRVVLTASGADSRGGGTAAARVTASLHDAGGEGTRVEVATDLDITGKAAQFGRGLIGDVSARLIGQFADCLAGQLSVQQARADEPIPAAEPEAEPIDLIAVSGVGVVVRRAVPYVVTAAASFAVVLGIIWWIRRR
jgi:carbon monoxide dehydrogenase subunit G